MEDRFKFRGRAAQTEYGREGKLIYGSLTVCPYNDQYRIRQWTDEHGWDSVLVDPKTVGQCTGLKDYKERPVFEGDIGRHPDGSTFMVEWWHDKWVARYTHDNQWSGLGLQFGERGQATIIGNIHENPELLEA